MERGILTQEYRHEPVMLGEVLESLQLKSGSVVCDCTLGGAGHSVKMAAQVGETGLLLGVDQDDMALEAAGARLDREVPGVPHQLLKGNFGDLDELLCSAEVPGVDGFLFDLGVSSPQLDIPGRGFSYNEDAPLDMRMDPGNNTLNAAEVINTYNEHDLARILRVYGEEKFASQIAREIVRRREQEPIETTGQFVEIIKLAFRLPLVGMVGTRPRRASRPFASRSTTSSMCSRGGLMPPPGGSTRATHLRHLVSFARGPYRKEPL